MFGVVPVPGAVPIHLMPLTERLTALAASSVAPAAAPRPAASPALAVMPLLLVVDGEGRQSLLQGISSPSPEQMWTLPARAENLGPADAREKREGQSTLRPAREKICSPSPLPLLLSIVRFLIVVILF